MIKEFWDWFTQPRKKEKWVLVREDDLIRASEELQRLQERIKQLEQKS
jgi:hypothetical protein